MCETGSLYLQWDDKEEHDTENEDNKNMKKNKSTQTDILEEIITLDDRPNIMH